jgi:hypothetical protein
MTPMFLNMSKKLFLTLAAIPAYALNVPERGEVFWRPARHPTLDALPHAGTPIDCSGTARSERHA